MINCFGSTFDNFLGKEGVLRQKLTLLFFFITDEVLNTLLFSSFSKKAAFSEKMAKPQFLGLKSLMKGTGRPSTKMNITSFMGNEILNIFYLTIFSKKAIFFEKMGEKFLGDMTIF